MADQPVDIELLLQHRAFVKALARRLVRDDARADDVVQDTYVTAMQNPPRHAGALRAWLATVVRKLAWTHTRGERRRAAREQRAAAPAPAPTPDEVLERANWHRRLVNLVMELDEPYRTTLLLRYFEDLNSSEIAEQQGVPAATVRTRLRRGLEQIRARLDEETPGGRDRWLAGLVVLAWSPREIAAAAAASRAPGAGRAPRWPAVATAVGVLAVAALVVQVRRAYRESVPRRPSAEAGPVAEGDRAETRAGRQPGDDLGSGPRAGRLLDVTVLADGRPAAGARVVVAVRAGHPWRYSPLDRWEVWGRARADRDGGAHFARAPDGYLRILAALPGHARGEAFAYLPQEVAHPVVVELLRAPPLAVVARAGTRPVAGATIELRERNGDPWWPRAGAAPTDAAGRSVVDGVHPDARVVVRAPGYAPSVPRAPPAAGPLEVQLESRTRTVRWPLRAGAGAQPGPGTPLVVRRVTEEEGRPARVDGGDVVVDGLGPGIVPELVAIAPDGSFARLQAGPGDTTGPTVAFAAAPRLAVTVRDAAGAPLPGIDVRLVNEATGGPVHPGGVTGADGRVSLPVYAADPLLVELRERGDVHHGPSGRYDPAQGGGALDFELPRARPVRMRVDGGLPDGWELCLGRRHADPAVEDDADLTFLVRARELVQVHLLAPGFVPVTRLVDPLPRAPAELAVALAPAGTLVLTVARAQPAQPYSLELVPAEEGAAPLRRGPWPFRLYPGPDHVVRETMLPPGRFRVRDRTSGAATPEFDIPAGGATVHLRLDLTDVRPAERVSGRVVATSVVVPRGTEVVAVEQGPDGRSEVVPVARDGTFGLPWRGAAPLRMYARHPRDGEGPAVTVTQPRDGLVLHLDLRRHARLRLDPAPPVPPVGATAPRVQVAGSPVVLDALLDGDTLRFAGYEPGEARLRVDIPGFAPAWLGPVTLPDAAVDLGTLALERGASLRFTVLVRPGEEPPALTISARAAAAPSYQRSCRGDPGRPLVLGGLGPGVFHVTAWERGTGLRVWARDVEVQPGDTTREVAIDLR